MEVKPLRQGSVPTGYKQTEVGAIPEDWAVVPLAKRLSRPPTYGINAPAIPFDSRYPTYLRITDITEDGRFAETTKASVDHPASTAYLLDPGDLVFARTGASVGKSYLYNQKDGRLVFAGFLIRIAPDPERLVPAFLAFFVQTCTYWNWVKVNSMRSGQPGINGREYASLPIPLPPTKAEQEAIAEALSDADALIESLEQLLTKKRQLKQGAMQELLIGKKRLPEFSGKWEDKSVAELAGGDENVVDGPFGSNLKNSDYIPTGVPVLQGLNISGDRFVWKEVRYISEKKARDLVRSNAQIGDLLTVKIGSVGFSALIDHLNGHTFAIIPANLLRIRIHRSVADSRFVYYKLTSEDGKRALKDLAANTAQPALNLSGVRKLLVYVPKSVEEQAAIANILSDMDAEIAALEAKLAKARQLKQGMMQELLTGRIRLPLPQAVKEA